MSYRSEVKWSEQDEYGYEYVVGEAFGYRMCVEVGPRHGDFEWRVTILDQRLQPGTCHTREEARTAALRCAANWLLFQAVDARHHQRVRSKDKAEGSEG